MPYNSSRSSPSHRAFQRDSGRGTRLCRLKPFSVSGLTSMGRVQHLTPYPALRRCSVGGRFNLDATFRCTVRPAYWSSGTAPEAALAKGVPIVLRSLSIDTASLRKALGDHLYTTCIDRKIDFAGPVTPEEQPSFSPAWRSRSRSWAKTNVSQIAPAAGDWRRTSSVRIFSKSQSRPVSAKLVSRNCPLRDRWAFTSAFRCRNRPGNTGPMRRGGTPLQKAARLFEGEPARQKWN